MRGLKCLITYFATKKINEEINYTETSTDINEPLGSEYKNEGFIKVVKNNNNNEKRKLFSEVPVPEENVRSAEDLILLKNLYPGQFLDFKNKKISKIPYELVLNLNLSLNYKVLFTFQNKYFNQQVVYDSDLAFEFRDIVINKKGYLYDERNFIKVPEGSLSKDTNCIFLVNSRVVLFWKNIYLNDLKVKRILTLGLCYLSNIFNKTQLIYSISEEIPVNKYDIKIRDVTNSYLIIGIEPPIFSF